MPIQPAAIPKMVPAAFLIVVLIWSTTPLGIVWSSETVNPSMAVLLRMLFALIIGALMMLVARISLPTSRTALRLYAVSSIGIVGGMSFSYYSAKYLPSGTISLIFGLSPLFSGVLAQKLLGEPKFGPMRILALLLAFIGLAVVCSSKLSLESDGWIGLVLILSGVFLFSLSGVLIKTVDITIHPLASTVGALMVSTPLFALSWLIFDGTVPMDTWSQRSIYSIIYLGVFGSLIGFIGYFYILQHLKASTVALVTLITPVFAMMLGAQLNGEVISDTLVMGAILVISGLGLYQFGDKWLNQAKLRRQNKLSKLS